MLPLTAIAGALLPPIPIALVQKQKCTTTASPYKMALDWELASQQPSLATIMMLTSHFSLASIHIYGLSVGESPPHINFNKRGHLQGWCTQKVLEEYF